MRVVICCDRSKNFVLERNEREILTVRLSMINGVIFDEEAFRREFTGNISLQDIMNLVQGLNDDEGTSAVGKIFRLEPMEMWHLSK